MFRTYSGEGGLLEELMAQAAAHPDIAEFRVIGQTHQGQDIGAVRLTKNVAKAKDGKRPTTVYVGAQHAREWITPEMVRRLLDLYRDLLRHGSSGSPTSSTPPSCGSSPSRTRTATTTPSRRASGSGARTCATTTATARSRTGDGVDLNRNYPTRWGYDNEGSSPNPASDTYRGPAPASEPETQALDALFADITPQFLVNYHSAAELLLHGIGWQVATPVARTT